MLLKIATKFYGMQHRKLTFVRGFPLRAYEDVPKENHGYSVLFHAGVASCPHGFVKKMVVSNVQLLTQLGCEATTVCARVLLVDKGILIRDHTRELQSLIHSNTKPKCTQGGGSNCWM